MPFDLREHAGIQGSSMPRLAHTMRSPAFGGMPASTPTWMGVEAGRTRLNARQIHSCRSKAQSGLTGTTGVVAGCGQGTHARDVVRPRATSCDVVRRHSRTRHLTCANALWGRVACCQGIYRNARVPHARRPRMPGDAIVGPPSSCLPSLPNSQVEPGRNGPNSAEFARL